MKVLIISVFGAILQIFMSRVQGNSCQIFPTECAYEDNSVLASETDATSCQRYEARDIPQGIDSTQYLYCTPPIQLTDSDLGSENYEQDRVYIWNNNGGTMLFTFQQNYTFTQIKLHYYSSSTAGLPRVTFYSVSDDFMIWTHLPPNPIVNVGPAKATPTPGPWVATVYIQNTTRKIAMHVGSASYKFHLSEVEFFTCRTQVAPRTVTSPNNDCEPTSTNSINKPGITTTNEENDIETTPLTPTKQKIDDPKPELSTKPAAIESECNMKKGDDLSLPWICVGVLTSVLCLWLAVNIICVAVCLKRGYHRRNYKLKRNPSYATTSPIYRTKSEEHIYDTPQ